MPTIGLIGAGHIGSQVARLAVAHGYDVVLSNSRGPETLAALVAELGPHARAATPVEAAEAGDIVVVTIPLKSIRHRARSSRWPARSSSTRTTTTRSATGDSPSSTTSRRRRRSCCRRTCRIEGGQGVQPHLRRASSRRDGQPAGTPNRRALVIAGDDAGAKATVTRPARRVRLRHGRRGPAEARAGGSSATRRATDRAATPRSCGGTSRRRSATATCSGCRRGKVGAVRHS